jgi:hypothetical protein
MSEPSAGGERDPVERSPSGAPVLWHQSRLPAEDAVAQAAAGDAIRAHVEEHVGPIRATFAEVDSQRIRLDVHVVAPSVDRPHHTLVTSGMSALPMAPPEGMEECRFAELTLALPPEWPILDREALEDEAHYWPLRWLKTLARFPHEYGTWLYWQHTVPNGEPPRPFAANTAMSSLLLLDPVLPPPAFARLELPEGEELAFFGVYPLHPAELEHKLSAGADALELELRRRGVTELLQPDRESVI